MAGDVFGVHAELLEDHLGESSSDVRAATSVEALRVCQQIEGDLEELAAGFQLAGRVGELVLDLRPFPLDGRQLRLDLGPWPVGAVQQI